MKNEFFLVSVKSKSSQAQVQIFVVRREDLSSFIEVKLFSDSVLLIDSIDMFVPTSEQ